MLDEFDVAFKKQLMYKQIKLNKLTSRLKNIITNLAKRKRGLNAKEKTTNP